MVIQNLGKILKKNQGTLLFVKRKLKNEIVLNKNLK